MKKSAPRSGQALLIILLVMAVGLTIALSIVSRSVTDIRISQEEEESARAFSAAEAGIEESLRAGSAVSPTGFRGISVQVADTGLGGEPEFVFEQPAAEGGSQTVWLVNHDPDGNLIEDPRAYTKDNIDVCWQETDPETALEVSIFYKDSLGNYKVARGAYDDQYSSRGEGFDPPDAGGCAGLERKKTLNLPSLGITATENPLALRLRPLYNSARIGVVAEGPDGLIPVQGKCFESTATTEAGVSRKVRQCQSYPAPSAIFDFVLFSGSDIDTAL